MPRRFHFRSAFAERPPLRRAVAHLHYRWLIVGTVCVGAFLGQLDASIAGLVLPTIEDIFRAPVSAVEWVAIAYLLTLAVLVVPFGRLADLAGRKNLYTGGFLVFIVGSGLCGIAPSLPWLIGFRVLQAIGAAMLQANSVAIITASVGRRELGRAIGIQGAAQAVGLSVGPSVGGLLIDSLGWRWVFLIAVPFGLVGTLMGALVLPQTPPGPAATERAERFDWIGAGLFGPAIGLLLLALTYANQWGWASRNLLLTVGVAAVVIAFFLAAERRASSPLLDFALFRNRIFSAGLFTGLLSYSVMFGCLFLVPFYLERILGRSAAETGLLLSPVPMAIGVLAPFAGLVADRYGARLPTVSGMLLAALALLALAFGPQLPLVGLLATLCVLGAGLGLFTPANNAAIMGSAPRNRLGVAGGVLNMTRSLGTSLGVAGTGAVLVARLSAHAGHTVENTLSASSDVLLPSFHETLYFLVALALIAAAFSSLRGAPARAADDTARQPVLTESGGL